MRGEEISKGMMGCQSTDKKRKVNVKLGDHKERTCPLAAAAAAHPLPLASVKIFRSFLPGIA